MGTTDVLVKALCVELFLLGLALLVQPSLHVRIAVFKAKIHPIHVYVTQYIEDMQPQCLYDAINFFEITFRTPRYGATRGTLYHVCARLLIYCLSLSSLAMWREQLSLCAPCPTRSHLQLTSPEYSL